MCVCLFKSKSDFYPANVQYCIVAKNPLNHDQKYPERQVIFAAAAILISVWLRRCRSVEINK